MSAAAMASLQRELQAGEEEEQYATPLAFNRRGKPSTAQASTAMERTLRIPYQD